jgi:sugar phosphate isomerase/epimerase
MPRYAVSSWSLDGLLDSGVPLLDIPAQLQQHGIATFELCHFHLPTTDAAYLHEVRNRLADSGVELFSVLIDAGDIAAPDPAQRATDTAFTQDWIEIAARLGASRVRIDAGQQPPTPEVVRRSAEQLHALARFAASRGVAVSTENWRTTSREPEALLAILDACASHIGLCVDTGNAEATQDKYQTLTQLLPRATSVHFKARYTPAGSIEADDAQRCLSLFRAAAFDGVVTLIYDRKQREWEGVEQLRAALNASA